MEYIKDKYDDTIDKSNQLNNDLLGKNHELRNTIYEISELKKVMVNPNLLNKLLSKKYKEQKARMEELVALQSRLEQEIKDLDLELQNLYSSIGNIPNYVTEREKLRTEQVTEDGILVIDGTKPLNVNCVNIRFKEPLTIDDLVLVHATNSFPQNRTIRCAKEKMVGDDIQVAQHRLTTHFAINGRVGNHTLNVWDDMGIIIIDPLNKHIDEISNLLTVDTFKRGDFQISNKAVIMVSEKVFDTIPPEAFSEYTIVKFTGDSITATNKMLLMLGYKPQIVNKDTWASRNNQELFDNFVQEQYPEKRSQIHSGSIESNIETMLKSRDRMIAKMKGLNEINGTNGFSNIPLSELRDFWLFANKDVVGKDDIKEVITDFDSNRFYNMCINYGVSIKNDSISFLGTEDTLELQKNAIEDKNYNKDLYYDLFIQVLGIKPLDFEEYNNSFESLLQENVPEGEDVNRKSAFSYFTNPMSTVGSIILFNGNYYQITEDYIKDLDSVYRKYLLNKEMSFELYNIINSKKVTR